MYTGQHGPWMLPVGFGILGLIVIGACVLWRRGLRSVATMLAGYWVLLVLMGGYQCIRSRYLVPVLPLMVWASVEGLCWIVRKFQAPGPRPDAPAPG